MATDSSFPETRIQKERAAFQADFERMASEHADEECLTPEEILSLPAGGALDLAATEHLAHCSVCSALKQAIRVDPARMQQFREAMREMPLANPPNAATLRDPQPGTFEWRLPAAAAVAFISFAMLVLVPKSVVLAPSGNSAIVSRKSQPPLQIPNARLSDSAKSSSQVQIAVQPPSGPPMQFVSTAPITVKDVAPQVATAAVLSQSAITLPVNASAELTAEVTQEASDILYGWLAPTVTDQAPFKNFPSVAYLPAEKSYRLTLAGGRASLRVPEIALENGREIKAMMLSRHNAIASFADENPISMKLTDGYVVSIDWKSQVR